MSMSDSNIVLVTKGTNGISVWTNGLVTVFRDLVVTNDERIGGSLTVTGGVYEAEGAWAGPTNAVAVTSNYTYSVTANFAITNLTGTIAGLVGATTLAWSNGSGANWTGTVYNIGPNSFTMVCTNGKLGSLSIRSGAYPRIGGEQDP
jgi:hypothetical protein